MSGACRAACVSVYRALLGCMLGRAMSNTEKRWLQAEAKCRICSHTWQGVFEVDATEGMDVDGEDVLYIDSPTDVECPNCGNISGEVGEEIDSGSELCLS